jgi:indole-3-glycerol phosphate synthase
VKCESLRETARNFHLATYEEIRKQLERESREKQLRTQFMKKKNSVIREYKKVSVSQSGRRSKDEPEAVEEFMDHYFMTAEGRHALSEMPEWVFRPKELKPPVELDPEIQQ